jgi:hypothetical protein
MHSPKGWSAKKAKEEDYLMGYTGVPQLYQEDLERLGFQNPAESMNTIGTARVLMDIRVDQSMIS